MEIQEEIQRAEEKLRDLNSKIKNAENTLRQVSDAVNCMRVRLDKYETAFQKAMRG